MATTAGQGMVYTSDTAKSALLSSNRDYNNRLTWQNLYNANDVAATQAENQLVKSYTDASAAAYVSYLQNQNAIKNSAIVGSGKQSLVNDAYSSWQSTLSSYQSSLSSGLSSISESKEESDAAIDELLEEQADYTADYVNAHYSYLEALYEQYEAGENTLFDEGSQWYKYLTTDEDGNVSLKSWSDLTSAAWEEVENEDGTITKEYTSLFDEDDNLTVAGVDFFDQLENQLANEGGYSWGEYLAETNEDLYNWANSYNPYNYTQEGTNAGTMRTMFGMMSTDYAYTFAERFGGLTSNQIDSMFSDFQSTYDTISSAIESGEWASNGEYITSTLSDMFESIQELTDSLGITSAVEDTLGMSFEEVISLFDSYDDSSYGTWDIVSEYASDILAALGIGRSTVSVVSGDSSNSSSNSGSSSNGFWSDLWTGVKIWFNKLTGQYTSDKTNSTNLSYATSAAELYNEILVALTSFASSQKSTAQRKLNENIY